MVGRCSTSRPPSPPHHLPTAISPRSPHHLPATSPPSRQVLEVQIAAGNERLSLRAQLRLQQLTLTLTLTWTLTLTLTTNPNPNPNPHQVAVKQFQTLDTDARGYLEVRELVAAFGSIPQASKENALLMAQG